MTVPASTPKASNKKWIAIATVALMLGGFGYLAYGGIGENIVYFLTPGELVKKGEKAVERPVRLGGQVVDGSVVWNADNLDLRFKVTDGQGTEVLVHSRGAPPQMFRAGIGVVVEGKYGRDGVFQSDNLMVKHSNEYRAPNAEEMKHPERLNKTLMRESRS